MDDDYMLDKVLVKIKELKGIEKLDDTNIFVDTDDKLLDDITLEKCCNINDMCYYGVIKDDRKFYP